MSFRTFLDLITPGRIVLRPDAATDLLNQLLLFGARTLTYGPTVTPSFAGGASLNRIDATNGTAFTIANPAGTIRANATDVAALLVLSLENSSGGALGTITFDAGYRLAGAFTAPATGQRRVIAFLFSNLGVTARGIEIYRTAADQPV